MTGRIRQRTQENGQGYSPKDWIALNPTLIPFGKGRAMFFCIFPLQATKVVNLGPIPTQGTIVTLNKWNARVNTFDLMKYKFEGWIIIRGLSLNRWNKETFIQ